MCVCVCDRYGLSASRLREVASQLEDMSAQRIDQVGGEGLQGAVARAGLHDVLGMQHASTLSPQATHVRKPHTSAALFG